MKITFEDVQAAYSRIGSSVVRTALDHSGNLSEMLGQDVYLKYENHQFTGSFKERGALNRLLLFQQEGRLGNGVIAVSAGNHAQAVAYHASRLGIHATIVMPRFTPNTKVERTRGFGAEVVLTGINFAEAVADAERIGVERGLVQLHPYDDPAVIAGQGTLAMEMLEQEPDLGTIVTAVGGGGLLSGIAIAAKKLKPGIRVIGAQADAYAGAADLFRNEAPRAPKTPVTIAEGIAVKHPGHITGPILQELVDNIVVVSESAIEAAVYTLMSRQKTVAEGAGAVPLAALSTYPELAKGKIALVLSGGNIDMMSMTSVVQRGLVRTKRLVRIRVMIPDVPGALSEISRRLGELDSNIVEIDHRRIFGGSYLGSLNIEFVLSLCGEEQADLVLQGLRDSGYDATLQEV